jgi:thiosulfate dehydrogenase [quinone] large subunit
MRIAAVAGMALSLGLFLTISFHSSPYFTGSDIVFLFAWTPIVLAGAGGAVALDTWLARREQPPAPTGAVSRRAVLSTGALTGATAAVVVVAGGLAALIGRAVGGTTTTAASGATRLSGPTTAPSTTSPTTTPSSTTTTAAGSGSTTTSEATTPTTAAPPSGTAIGAASSVPVGGSASFTVPASGDPGLVIQQTAGEFVAFDAVCPHAGCTVAYVRAAKIIACPCHGSEFNAKTGAVIQGPATTGLTTIKVIRGSNGDLYVPA